MKKQRILLLKTVSYRILGSVTTAVIVFCFSNEWKISLRAGAAELVIKLVIYYLHDLVWYKALKRSK